VADSAVQICNMALASLGVTEGIDSLTSQDNTSMICNMFYPVARDGVLAAFDWPFARRVAALAKRDDVTPAPPWKFAFAYPLDCVPGGARQIATGYSDSPWGMLGQWPPGYPFAIGHHEIPQEARVPFAIGDDGAGSRVLYCDFDSPTLIYTGRIETVGSYPASFILALSANLASMLCGPLAQPDKTDSLIKVYRYHLGVAMAQAANEGERGAPWLPSLLRSRN
jgi:hypothetical protein